VGVKVSVAVLVGVLVLVIVQVGWVVWVASKVSVDGTVGSPPPVGPQEQRQMLKQSKRKYRIARIT
jgi:uncharacterized protein YneF (UPF0154 family)